MYCLLALLIGAVISVMVAVNGNLSALYGVFGAAVIIHVVGCVFSFLWLKIRRQKISVRDADIPVWYFLGGAIGFFTTLFNNFSYGKISMSAIVALGLLGQMITSLLLDTMGLLGMKKVPLRRSTCAGILLSLIGISVMVRHAEIRTLYAFFLSVLSGVTVVASRAVNAGLSGRIGGMQGSFVNHMVGLPCTVAALFLLGRSDPIFGGLILTPKIWIYLGGTLGVMVVFLSNLTVPQIPVFLFSLFSFVGEIGAGILFDILSGLKYSKSMLYGTAFVASGIVLNMIMGRHEK